MTTIPSDMHNTNTNSNVILYGDNLNLTEEPTEAKLISVSPDIKSLTLPIENGTSLGLWQVDNSTNTNSNSRNHPLLSSSSPLLPPSSSSSNFAFNRAYSMPIPNSSNSLQQYQDTRLVHPDYLYSTNYYYDHNNNYNNSTGSVIYTQQHTHSLPNIYANPSPVIPSSSHYPPSSSRNNDISTTNQFIPATTPSFIMSTPYGITPITGTNKNKNNNFISNSTTCSPRKSPLVNSAIALEAGNSDSQVTLVDDSLIQNNKPWYSKMVNAVSSIGTTIWSTKDTSHSVINVPYTTNPTNYFKTDSNFVTSSFPHLVINNNALSTTPSDISVTIHQTSINMTNSTYPVNNNNNNNNNNHYQHHSHLFKQPVPGIGTYNGYSKVHPSLRHYSQQPQRPNNTCL